MAPFRKAARWVGRGIDPFVRLSDAFRIGAAYAAAEDDADDDDEPIGVPQELTDGL